MHHRPPFNASTDRSSVISAYDLMIWSVPLRVPRILGWCRNAYRFPKQPKEWSRLAPEAAAQYCRLQAWRTEATQGRDEDGSKPAKTGPFGDMPCVVLSHDPKFSEFRFFFPPAEAAKAQVAWTKMQEELRSLSSRSKGIVAKGRYHYVQIYRPELVVAAVHEVVSDVRGTAPFQAGAETEYK